MSSRGRPTSADCTRIAILGLLCRHGDQHGYELRKRIVEQNINDIADVQLGSIYAAFKKLADEGLVEKVGETRSGNRPARSLFRVTALGKKQLHSMIAHAFVDPVQPERPVDLALHFSGLLAIEEVVELLEQRLTALEKFAAIIDRAATSTPHEDPAVLELMRDIPEHFRRINRAELEWTTLVLAKARSGAYRTGRPELA